jgi:hypothetical protein
MNNKKKDKPKRKDTVNRVSIVSLFKEGLVINEAVVPDEESILPTSTKTIKAAVKPKTSAGKTRARYANKKSEITFSHKIWRIFPKAPLAF